MSFDLNPSGDKDDAPTNPLFTDTSINNDERIFTAIAADGANTFTTEVFTGTTQYSNLNTTKGFRIKCYDALTTDGIQFNPAAFDTHYYFVLVYSDTDTRHHFARITEILTEDSAGDAFEFEPKLGNEIPKDTKFMIFKGHPKSNSNILAFSAGILNNTSSLTLEDKLSCARPLFYFFDELLDKNNELDHNTKYYAMQKHGSISTTSHTFDTTTAITFRTVQDFGKVVIDYSRFTHRVKLTDKLRDLDVGGGGSTTKNEGGTVSLSYSSYQGAYPNARRMGDDEINSPTYTGPKRYLHYNFSPTKSNLLYNVYDHTNTESIDGKGGFAETSVIDNGRIMPRKVKEFDAYRVRHNIHRGDMNEFFALAATYSSKTSNAVFSFNTEYNLNTVLNAGDEVKLGDNILIVQSFGSLSGTTQEITFQSSTHPYVRTENDGAFTAQSTTPTSGDVLQRRAYNATDGTLMLDISLLNGRFSKMYVAFTSLNHNERFATITACDATKGMITLSFDTDSYHTNPLSFAKGQYQIFIERFNGEVENIENKKENGQTIMEIQGRDKFSKLLSPIVNLNTLFSEDIIYSSNSPYNKLSQIDSTTLSIALGDTTKATGIAVSAFDIVPTTGDKIFTVNGYIGEITSTSGDPLTINFTAALTEANSEIIYIDTEKNYVLSKALGSSHLATNKPSSLTGAANKGLIFTAGNKIKRVSLTATTNGNTTVNIAATGEDTLDLEAGMIISGHSGIPTGTTIVSVDSTSAITISASATNSAAEAGTIFFGGEDTSLVSTSANASADAIGYAIHKPSSISNDFAFQSKLKDEHGSAGESSFDTVNTLIDFEVVSTSKKDNITEIELAPYIPITLGRKIPNFGNTEGYTLTERATIEHTGANLNSSSPNIIEATNDGIKNLDRNDPVFIGASADTATFAGFVRTKKMIRGTADQSNLLYLDRDFTTTAGHKIYSVSKDTHDLFLINGAHLWGGKILSLPHSKLTSTGPVPLNVENVYGSNTDTNKKYGQSLYKTISMSFGQFNILQKEPSNAVYGFRRTYPNNSQLGYAPITYKFSPNTASNNKNAFDKTGTGNDIHMDFDMRGFGSAYGSLFSGLERIRRNQDSKYPDDFSASVSAVESLLSSVSQKVSNAATLFLYITSDLLPYSSLRKDSLMDGNKNLVNYNLFLVENNKVKDKVLDFTETSTGNQLLLTDNSFQTISITDNTDISALKRFGLMRLTEICFDIHYNLFNPEKDTVKNRDYFSASQINGYTFSAVGTLSSTSITNSLAASTTTLILDTVEGSNPPTGTDILYDANYKRIGTVSSYNSGTKTITLGSAAILNDDATFTVGTVYQQSRLDIIYLEGTKDANTFISKDRAHIQKGAIITDHYLSDSGDVWEGNNDGVLNMTNEDIVSTPIRYRYSNTGGTLSATPRALPTKPMDEILPSTNARQVYKHSIGVVLDTYSIEQGQKHPIEKGLTIPFNIGNNISFDDGTANTFTTFITLGNTSINYQFGDKYPDGTSNTLTASGSEPYEATGIKFGIKPRLYYNSGISGYSTATITSSNGDLYQYNFAVYTGGIAWMDFIDLTGCYLISEAGYDTDLQAAVSSGDEDTHACRNMNGVIPQDIIYVVSHTVRNDSDREHRLILDKQLTHTEAYRILKPNETTFYDFMPEQIHLNMLSSKYTKMPEENKVYEVNQDIEIVEGTKEKTSAKEGPRRESFLSMFVAIDPDKQSNNENHLIVKNAENFLDILGEGEYSLFASDGENNMNVAATVKSEFDFTGEQDIILTLSNMKTMKGVVSFSETFTLNTTEELKIDPTRACIGSTVSVGLEGEDLINELLEQEGIEFTTTSTDTPMYLAPNYQGVDLYSAIRYILDRKDMKLVEENDVFKIFPESENSLRTNITIDDSGEFLISEFDKVSTLFDFFNEINVYGNAHKAIRKDLRSIQKRGRKTLEVVDNTLLTQEEVDKKATKLLQIHSRLNQKLSFTMQNKGISQLRVGDIVNVFIPRENIEMNEYIVLEMEHQLTGFIKLQLGRYSKDLSDVFSELLISSKETKAALRSANLQSNEISYNFLNTLNTKELKLLVRKRSAGGAGRTLGFGTALGFTTPLGFTGGAITITDLVEEDLA